MQRRSLPFILGDIAKIDLAGEARPWRRVMGEKPERSDQLRQVFQYYSMVSGGFAKNTSTSVLA